MLTGVSVFLLLLFASLAIPVTLTFHVSWHRVFQNEFKLIWAFGLVRVRIPSYESKARSPKGEEVGKRIDPSERSSRKGRNVFSVVRQKEFRRRIIRFVGDLWHAVYKKNIVLRVCLGLGDPADTGQLWSILGPVAGILANVQEASIKIEPEFFDATFELDSSGSIRIIPLQMICLIAALLMSPPVWKGIKQVRTARS